MPRKLKAAFFCPCIGTGGADALMCGLIAQTRRSIDWQAIGILRGGNIEPYRLNWVRDSGAHVPIYANTEGGRWWMCDGVVAHGSAREVALAAAAGCDVVVSWCVQGGVSHYDAAGDAVIIEYMQNQDRYAVEVVEQNIVRAHALAACSNAAAKSLPESLRERATILYNAVDPRRVVPALGRDRTRQLLRIGDSEKLLLFLGRFAAEKNPQAMIQALTKLPDEWRGVFVGCGAMREHLDIMAKAMCPGRVQFVDYTHHVGDFYAAADVFLLASDFEGDSLAIHEASLAGLPIVTTDVGSVPELTERFGEMHVVLPRGEGTIDGRTRRRRNTPEELAASVLRADSQEFRDGPALRAQAVRWEHFTLPTIAAQWEEYLHGVVEIERTLGRYPQSVRAAFAEPMERC